MASPTEASAAPTGETSTTFEGTRGSPAVSFAEALTRGMAPDGGLYVPRAVAAVPRPPAGDATFADTARRMGRALLGAEAEVWLDDVVGRSLDFDVPLHPVGSDRWILELFHGPTLAFKDVGARFMAAAMEAVAPPVGLRTVLVATSGDTGSAVARAFLGAERTRVVVLFPADGVAARQRKQMTTLGGNVVAAAVDGSFDDCQRMAKEAFADGRLTRDQGLTSANSINVGRLVPQTFYYAHAARRLGWSGASDGARPTFVVPSGNLGNLCAGLLAAEAGVPVGGFVAASNANRVFVDRLAGKETRPRPSMPTLSNAMDVAVPSNLERLEWMYRDRPGGLAGRVRGHAVDDETTLAVMARVHHEHGVVLDPHTAVAWAAADRDAASAGARTGRDGSPRPGPVVILATAHPAKFPEAVARATGREPPVPDALAEALAREERTVSIGPDLADLRSLLEGMPPP